MAPLVAGAATAAAAVASTSVGPKIVTGPLVRRMAGGWLIRNVIGSGMFMAASEKHRRRDEGQPPSTMPLGTKGSWSSQTSNMKNNEIMLELPTQQANHGLMGQSKKWGLRVVPALCVLTYIAYPIALLLLFRISEHISWLRLFERYHACQRTPSNTSSDCLQLYGIHGMQLGFFIIILTLCFKLLQAAAAAAKNNSNNDTNKMVTGNAMALLVFMSLCIAGFTYSVDEVALYRPSNDQTLLQGKVAVVTGANRGIGLATAKALAHRGAHVVLTCRSLAKCEPVVAQINEEGIGTASAARFDLSSLESAFALTQQLTQDYPAIHYVFANAGTTPSHNLTKEGLEDAFGGMHLAHMAVVLGLLPSLRRGGELSEEGQPSRVVMVSSEMAINRAIGVFGNDPLVSTDDLRGEITRGDGTLGNSLPAYARAKLCNVLFAMELNRRMTKSQWPVRANAVHTGAVVTASSRESIQTVFRHFPGLSWLVGRVYFPLLWRSVSGGARVLLCAALSDARYVVKGGQYLDALCHPFLPEESETYSPTDKYETISIHFPQWGASKNNNKPWTIFKDPIQALQFADSLWSEMLWSVSLSLLEKSPAKAVVSLAP